MNQGVFWILTKSYIKKKGKGELQDLVVYLTCILLNFMNKK